MNSTKKNKWIDGSLFAICLMVYGVLTFTLFCRQAYASMDFQGLYASDFKAYILEMQGLDSGYSFPYPIFFKLGALLYLFLKAPELSMAVAVTILNLLSPLFLKLCMDAVLLEGEKKQEGKDNAGRKAEDKLSHRLLITASVFAIFFVSMVYPPNGIFLPGIQNHYVGVFTPNPFHNATYNATRPFAILAFFLFPVILKEYEEKINVKHNVVFGICLLLTTMTKPSFTFVLVPTAGLIMLYRLFKKKFQNFVPSVLLGLAFVPTFIALLYQFFGVFAPAKDGESGIGFGLATAWRLHCSNIPLAIGLALGFPILVLLLNYRELLKNSWYRFSWQLLVVSLCEVLFLYEKGFRLPDMNFSWGYMHGIFFVFVGSVMVLLQRTWQEIEAFKGADESSRKMLWKSRVFTGAQWLALLWHLSCGLYYFYGIFRGQFYY